MRQPTEAARLKCLKEIVDTCGRLRDVVEQAVGAGRTPVVPGGDHSVAVGTIAGLAHRQGVS